MHMRKWMRMMADAQKWDKDRAVCIMMHILVRVTPKRITRKAGKNTRKREIKHANPQQRDLNMLK